MVGGFGVCVCRTCAGTPPPTLQQIGGGCEDRVLDGPASGVKGSKGGNLLDCIRGKGVKGVGLVTYRRLGLEAALDHKQRRSNHGPQRTRDTARCQLRGYQA